MPAPTHDRQKHCSKLKGKMTEDKEHQAVTGGGFNWLVTFFMDNFGG